MSERTDEVQALLDQLANEPRSEHMTERETEFVSSLSAKSERYGSGLYVSDKQLFWLRDIKGKYCDGVAPAPRPRTQKRSDEENYKQIQQRKQQESSLPLYDDDIPF